MKTKKKSRFLTFCFSLIPGAGEMYMGFMRMGVSLMLLFFLAIFIPIVLRLEALATLAIIVWFYGFFHANHLASLSDEEFNEVKDTDLLGAQDFTIAEGRNFTAEYGKWIAIVLIAAGILLLWNTATDMAYSLLPKFIYRAMNIVGNYAPRILVSMAVIFIGVKMIEGRKMQLVKLEEKDVWQNSMQDDGQDMAQAYAAAEENVSHSESRDGSGKKADASDGEA